MGRLLLAATLLIVVLCATAQCTVFVLQSGKRVEGTIILEEPGQYRVRDASGIELRIKKGQLDMASTASANRPRAELAGSAQLVPAAKGSSYEGHVFTNADITVLDGTTSGARPSIDELQVQVKVAERDYARLTGQCRSAGAAGVAVKKTKYYKVNGKTVAVTGYYADPSEIERAKAACSKAMQAGSLLERIKDLLRQLLAASQ